tara:strand:+ start:2951 stop:3430 length:480 start_codon:yes stop_codon:yes gene_type:complete
VAPNDVRFELQEIDFDFVKPIWHEFLWPNRKTPILPTSPIEFMGDYDKSLLKSQPHFYGVFLGGEWVGINSGFKTNFDGFRSRGLFVKKEYRRKGISQMLFRACERDAIKSKSKFLWSMPRKTAFPSYLKFGFMQTSDWIDEKYEFGPNCFVRKQIVDI